jgi:hypothetical protein
LGRFDRYNGSQSIHCDLSLLAMFLWFGVHPLFDGVVGYLTCVAGSPHDGRK